MNYASNLNPSFEVKQRIRKFPSRLACGGTQSHRGDRDFEERRERKNKSTPGISESKTQMAQGVITIVAALIAFAYGIVATVWPHRIQKWWISQRLRKKVALKIYGLFVESPRYILYLRVTGGVSLIVSLILFYSVLGLAGSMPHEACSN